MNKNFLIYINFIIDNLEGGYTNHSNDPGGPTKYGITQKVARINGYDGDMREIPKSLAIEIYYKDYWNNKIQQSIYNNVGFHVFDMSINSGYGNAIKNLQRALNVTVDGKLGIDTMNALSNISESEAIKRFCDERLKFYERINNKAMINGWRNRVKLILNVDWKALGVEYEKP